MKHIADKAGVSLSTVSRVINNLDYKVNHKTRQKVLDSVAECQYTPNLIARAMRTGTTNYVGVVIHSIAGSTYMEMYRAIYSELEANGYHPVMVSALVENPEQVIYQRMLEWNFCGVITCLCLDEPKLKQLMKSSNIKIPVVNIVDSLQDNKSNTILIDFEKGMRDLINKINNSGAKRLAYLKGNVVLTDPHVKGYILGCKELGISANPLYIIESDGNGYDDGYLSMEKLLRLPDFPHDILALNDNVAAGALSYLLDIEYKVPRDFRIIGFNDESIAKICRPCISTVKVYNSDAGLLAAKMMIDLLLGKRVYPTEIVFDFVERETAKFYI